MELPDKILAAQEIGKPGRKRRLEKLASMTTMASPTIPGGKSTQIERQAIPSKQRGYANVFGFLDQGGRRYSCHRCCSRPSVK
jgi:hypothetical protein